MMGNPGLLQELPDISPLLPQGGRDLTDRHISGETVMRQPAAALADVVALEAAQSA